MHIGYTFTTNTIKLEDFVKVAAIRVAVGDSVSAGQVVMELNSSRPGEKLILKCPDTGTVRSIRFEVGESFAGAKVTLLSLEIKDRTEIKDRSSRTDPFYGLGAISGAVNNLNDPRTTCTPLTPLTPLTTTTTTTTISKPVSHVSTSVSTPFFAGSPSDDFGIEASLWRDAVAKYDAFRELIVEKENL